MSTPQKFNRSIGFIGLGAMGLPMAKKLISAGYTVNGFDVDSERQKLAGQNGINGADSIKMICEHNEVVIVCLPNPTVSREVILGKDGVAINPGIIKLVIETSTLLPDYAVEFSEKLENKNISFLSAPMFGGKSSAESGQIWFVVEGKKDVFEKNKSIFDLMGRKTSYLGNPPQATIAKLARNLCRFANVATAIETINFIRHYTNDIKPIYELLVEDSLTNFDHVWGKTLKGYTLDNEEYYTSHISVKDLKLILEITKDLGVKMPITEVTKKLHKKMRKTK